MAIGVHSLVVLVALATGSVAHLGLDTSVTTGLTQETSMTGHVADASGKAVEGALIQLFASADMGADSTYSARVLDPSQFGPFVLPGINIGPMSSQVRSGAPTRPPQRVTTSDRDGNFEIPSVRAGDYLLTIQALSDDGTTLSAGARAMHFTNAQSVGPGETSWRLHRIETNPDAKPISPTGPIVYYITGRAASEASTSERALYSNRDGSGAPKPRYGYCIAGVAGTRTVECHERPAADTFSMAAAAQKVAPLAQLIVFSHGFNVNFSEAIRAAGALSTGTHRPVFVYDWASAKTLLYKPDEDRVRDAMVNYGTQFIEDLVGAVGVNHIVLLGHSMGARPTFAFAKTLTDERIGHGSRVPAVVLFAGDESEATIADALPRIRPLLSTVLNYTSNHDIPLLLSLLYHNGDQRIGSEIPRIIAVPQMDTIESSRAQTDWLGHGYYHDLRLLDDVNAALNGTPAAQRTATLKRLGGEDYFHYTPSSP